MNTENIAHEKRYRDWRAQYDAMFAPENRSPQQDEQFSLTDGYSIRSKAYHENQIIDQKYILQWEKISELEV